MTKKYRALWVKRPSGPRPEETIATGRLTSSFERRSLVRKHYRFEENELLNISTLALSADGGWARVKGTDCWIPAVLFGSNLVCISQDAKYFQSKQNMFRTGVSLKPSVDSDRLNSVAAKSKPSLSFKRNNKVNPKLASARSKKEKGMDKKELKKLIANLGKTHIGEEIEITFRSTSKLTSGKYRLLETKVGRGKGGSMLARVENVTSGNTLSFGTPNSNEVLNIIWRDENGNANLVGYADESSVPVEFVHDATNATVLKQAFEALIGKSNVNLTVEASDPSFAGTHKLLSAKRMAGRFGQIRLELERSDGTKFEIWSYRHSGIVSAVN